MEQGVQRLAVTGFRLQWLLPTAQCCAGDGLLHARDNMPHQRLAGVGGPLLWHDLPFCPRSLYELARAAGLCEGKQARGRLTHRQLRRTHGPPSQRQRNRRRNAICIAAGVSGVALWPALLGSQRAKRPPVARPGAAEAPESSRKWGLHVREACICQPCGQSPRHASSAGVGLARESSRQGNCAILPVAKDPVPANCTAGPGAKAAVAGTGVLPTCVPTTTTPLSAAAACCLARLRRPASICQGVGRLPRLHGPGSCRGWTRCRGGLRQLRSCCQRPRELARAP